MHETQVHRPHRREREIEIPAWNGVLRFRVHAPRPRAAMRVLGRVSTILGPFLVKVLGGRVRLPAAAKCSVCGNTDPDPINGERWLCPPEKPGRLTEEQLAAHVNAGPRVWPREWLLDERGQVQRLTVALALKDARWMGMVAQAVHDRLAAMALDGDEMDDLVCGLLVGACEFQQPGVAAWYPIRDAEQLDAQLEQCTDGAAALLRLSAAALETWVFPMLRGALTGTPRASTETETAGDSSPSAPTSPATGRALPRSAPNRG